MYSSEVSQSGVPIPKSFHDTTRPGDLRQPDQQRLVLVGEPLALRARVDRHQALALAAHRGSQRLDLGVGGEVRRDVLAELADLVRGAGWSSHRPRPASIASSTTRTMAAISSSVAARSRASSPMT